MKRKLGFTLVELSIVLVIIGLLIGGILVARSMIATANIEATVKQIGQFDAGVENFKTKYRYLPGDAPQFGGNGDGAITFDPFNNGHQVQFFGCEIGNFWNNINPQAYVGAACVLAATPPISSGANANVPASKIGKTGAYFVATALGNSSGSADYTNLSNYYIILDPTQAQSLGTNAAYNFFDTDATLADSAVKPSELLALDTKMDDGSANTGNVLSGNMKGIGGANKALPASAYTTPLATCSSGATYQVQNNSYECTPLIRIGAQTGDPQ